MIRRPPRSTRDNKHSFPTRRSSDLKGKRFVLPNSTVMIHQILGGYQGQGTDIEIHAKHTLTLGKRLNEILSQHTGKPIDQIKRDTERDRFMNAKEATEYGLVDGVLAKRSGILGSKENKEKEEKEIVA